MKVRRAVSPAATDPRANQSKHVFVGNDDRSSARMEFRCGRTGDLAMKSVRTALAVLVVVLAGCADAPPAPAGKDTYIISASTTWTFKGGGEQLPVLYTRADAFCRNQGKVLAPVSQTTDDGGVALNANAQLRFSCNPQ